MGRRAGRVVLVADARQRVAARPRSGPVRMELTYERIRYELEMGDRSARFDSAEPAGEPDDPAVAFAERLVGLTVGFDVSRSGRIGDVQGLERLWDGIDETGTASGDVGDVLRRGLGAGIVQNVLQLVYPVFPDRAVRVGDSWEDRRELPDPAFGAMNITSRYEMRGIERRGRRRVVSVDLAHRIELRGEGPLLDSVGRALGGRGTLRLHTDSAEGRGSVSVERRTGLSLGLDLDQEMRVELVVPVRVLGFEREVTVPVSVEQKIVVERRDRGTAVERAAPRKIDAR